MNAQKRKPPDRRKPPAKEPGFLAMVLMGTGRLLLRYPGRVASCLSVGVACSFVVANALWYQPGDHPSPFLRTRDPNNPDRIAGYRSLRRVEPADVTTFKIQRADNPPAPTPIVPTQTAAAVIADASLIADIQRELSRRGLYDGAADGVTGSRTEAAILFFEESAGMTPTGKPSREVLAALRAEPKGQVAHVDTRSPAPAAPVQAPVPAAAPQVAAAASSQITSPAHPPAEKPKAPAPTPHAVAHAVPAVRPTVALVSDDPVAAAIRATEKSPAAPRPPADIPSVAKATKISATPVKASAAPVATEADRIMQIQRGLLNIAYTDVSVDGVAGAQTRAAIRHFQKHYRLPETGEPDDAVLKKLKSIGAL
jgi:peptidoglycan hydrolase-like protein with peptidoglycan-binding domain